MLITTESELHGNYVEPVAPYHFTKIYSALVEEPPTSLRDELSLAPTPKPPPSPESQLLKKKMGEIMAVVQQRLPAEAHQAALLAIDAKYTVQEDQFLFPKPDSSTVIYPPPREFPEGEQPTSVLPTAVLGLLSGVGAAAARRWKTALTACLILNIVVVASVPSPTPRTEAIPVTGKKDPPTVAADGSNIVKPGLTPDQPTPTTAPTKVAVENSTPTATREAIKPPPTATATSTPNVVQTRDAENTLMAPNYPEWLFKISLGARHPATRAQLVYAYRPETLRIADSITADEIIRYIWWSDPEALTLDPTARRFFLHEPNGGAKRFAIPYAREATKIVVIREGLPVYIDDKEMYRLISEKQIVQFRFAIRDNGLKAGVASYIQIHQRKP